jgi:uncharacterized protein YndB with AHSA1/START domain
MTTQKLFKQRVRARMSKTGESYTTARQQLTARRDRLQPARTPLAAATELASDERITEATGKGWDAWLTILDRWSARDRTHRATADYLIGEHGVPGWYAQAITNGYERTRGLRQKHQQADGFTIYASKTVGVPIDVLFSAFTDEPMRRQWLTDGRMSSRSSQPDKVARFDWDDGATRVMVTFEDKGPTKSTAAVAHERLPDPEAAEAAKAAWKQRLAALKSLLEPPPAA